MCILNKKQNVKFVSYSIAVVVQRIILLQKEWSSVFQWERESQREKERERERKMKTGRDSNRERKRG